MDNIFGIGLPELILILAIAGMVMGPERIVRTARTLGQFTARLQSISRTFFRQLNAELDSADRDGQLRSTIDELNQLRQQVTDLRNEVMTLGAGAVGDTRQAARHIRRDVQNSMRPPDLGGAIAPPHAAADNGGAQQIYQPPILNTDSASGEQSPNGLPPPHVPVKLPRRVSVTEDPDE